MVAHRLRQTGGIITGAALIMAAVFTGMASGELAMFQQEGFGLAVAIILDATIIRIVLVPASEAIKSTIAPGFFLTEHRYLVAPERIGCVDVSADS